MVAQNYNLEISEYSEELKNLAAVSKSIVTKNQTLADAFEKEVIKDTVNFNYEQQNQNWSQVVLYIGINVDTSTVASEKYWMNFTIPNDNEYALVAIDTNRHMLYYKVNARYWREASSGEAITAPDSTFIQVQLVKNVEYTFDVYKGVVYSSTVVWYDSVSGKTSTTLPVHESVDTTRDTYPTGLSAIISTPEEYVVAVYRLQADSSMTETEKTAYTNAIAEFSTVGDWEDVREPVYLRDSNNFLILGTDGLPTKNPKRFKSVKYVGEKNTYYKRLVADYDIDPFTSRTTGDFEILYFSYASTISRTYIDVFIELYRSNITIFKQTIYNQAFENQESYRSWCGFYINWMTLMRYESDKMSNLHDVDLMQSRDITNMLYSSNLFEFDDIPLSYKRRIVKATERLIARKGTSQVFEDILGLFNLNEDVEILKYYLVKYFPSALKILELPEKALSFITNDSTVFLTVSSSPAKPIIAKGGSTLAKTMSNLQKAMEQSGKFSTVFPDPESAHKLIFSTKATDDEVTSVEVKVTESYTDYGNISSSDQPDWTRPEVGFLKTDINARSIQEGAGSGFNTSKLLNYEAFVAGDKSWKVTKDELLQQNFSNIQTKYFSISTAIDVVNNGMALSFLWGMLKEYQSKTSRENMNILINNDLNEVSSITLFEAMVGMLCLTLWKFGVEDIIPKSQSGVTAIKELKYENSTFPNENNLLPFSSKIVLPTDTNGVLTPAVFASTTDSDVTMFKKINSYIKGFSSPVQYKPLADSINGSLRWEAYQDYNHYRNLREMKAAKFTSTAQYDCFGESDTYGDFLFSVNPEFKTWLDTYDNSKDYDTAIIYLANLVEGAISTETFSFSISVGVNSLILSYVERMIRFFKSYTVDLKGVSSYIKISDPSDDGLHLMNAITFIAKAMELEENDGSLIYDWFASGSIKPSEKDELYVFDKLLTLKHAFRPDEILKLVDKWIRHSSSIELEEFVKGVDSQIVYDWLNKFKTTLPTDNDKLMASDLLNKFISREFKSEKFKFLDSSTLENTTVKLFPNLVYSFTEHGMSDSIAISSTSESRECVVIETQNHESLLDTGMTDRYSIK